MSVKWRVKICDFCGEEMTESGGLIIKRSNMQYLNISGEKQKWIKADACKKCADRISMCISEHFTTTSIIERSGEE